MDNSNGKINLNHDYQIKINVIDFPFILALILTEIKYVWDISLLGINVSDSFVNYGCIILLTISFFLRLGVGKRTDGSAYDLKSLGFALAFLGISLIIYFRSSDSSLVLLALFMIAAYGVDFRKIVGWVFGIKTFYLVLTTIAVRFGRIANLVYAENRGIHYGAGYTSYNQAPREYFYIVLCYLFLRDKKVTIKELVVIEILAWYYAAVTSSRTTFCITTLMVIWLLINRVSKDKMFENHFVQFIIRYIFVLSGLFSYLIIRLAERNSVIYTVGNAVSTGRIQLSINALNNYPPTIFGQHIDWVTIGLNNSSWLEYNYVDNSYLKMLLDTGVVYSILILIIMTWICNYALKTNNHILAVILVSIAIRCIVQSELLNVNLDIFILLIGAVFSYQNTAVTNNDSVPDIKGLI